jgi:carboxyl-terminal processing protease
MKKRNKIIVFTGIVSIAVLIFTGFKNSDDFQFTKNLDIFFTLFREVNLYYVDDVDPEKLINEGINGMLNSLDPYTKYIPESDLKDFEFQTTGKYGGIGALIRKTDEGAMIAEPYKGFPADKAGLKAGDVLLSIDGTKVKGKSLKDISEMLKGMPNSSLKLKIKKPVSEEIKEIELERENITISNVPYHGMLDEEIGYIRLTGFTDDAGNETREALKNLKNLGARGVILDIRDNPGGLLNEAVEVSNVFVPKNQEIVRTKGKINRWNKLYKTDKQPVDTLVPVAVLVSRGSASASEIVAGALQDLDRAVVIGKRTFGKGLVQTTRPLSYNSKLKVTTAKYYIPSGRCIQALDYSNRNEDGSVGHVPDSLIKSFQTKNGRTVYDGGGIRPDIDIENGKVSNITVSLYSKGLIFDYATRFHASVKEIPPVDQFEITDSIYSDFVQFLQGKDFDYQTSSEEKLEELLKVAKKEKYYDKAKEAFKELEVQLAHDKDKDLRVFNDEIKNYLEQEIANRYYYQEGSIKAAIEDDKEIDTALKILHDQQRYQGILLPTENTGTETAKN